MGSLICGLILGIEGFISISNLITQARLIEPQTTLAEKQDQPMDQGIRVADGSRILR